MFVLKMSNTNNMHNTKLKHRNKKLPSVQQPPNTFGISNTDSLLSITRAKVLLFKCSNRGEGDFDSLLSLIFLINFVWGLL